MHAPTRWLSAAFLAACLLCPSVALGAGTPVDQATKEQLEAAQKTFGAADVLYDAKRFDEAITAFRASYEIVASPNSRLMIARSLRELGRYGEAWKELEGTIADADAAIKVDEKYETTAKAAREDLARLKVKVAVVHVKVTGGEGPVRLDGRPIEDASQPLVLAPGKAMLTATRADGSEARAELELAAGSEQTVELDLSEQAAAAQPPVAPTPQPSPPPQPAPEKGSGPPLTTLAYVAGGIGAAGLLTFGVFGLMNNSKFSSLESDCSGGHCPADRQTDIDAGRRYQTIANIGLAVGVVGIGAGTALFLLGRKQDKERAALETDVYVGPGSVMVGGRF